MSCFYAFMEKLIMKLLLMSISYQSSIPKLIATKVLVQVYSISTSWCLKLLIFMKWAILVLFLYIFKQFSQIANSNRKSIRRARWPLDHHHYGPLRLLFWCWWKHLRKNKLWMLKYRNWNYNLDYETKLTSGQWSALVDLVINRSTSLRWYLVSNSELELGKCK